MSAVPDTAARLSNFGFLLRDVYRLCTRRFEHNARELGLPLPLPQCKVLAHLARNEGISQARLAELTDTDPMTLVRTLDRMQEDGWIERRADPSDRRAHRLHLREAARPVVERIWMVSRRTLDDAFAQLELPEREQLVEFLERVHRTLQAAAG